MSILAVFLLVCLLIAVGFAAYQMSEARRSSQSAADSRAENEQYQTNSKKRAACWP